MERNKRTAGITLVALVVTIVVLLILAGITIVYVFGDNGVFGKATQVKIETELGKIEEQAGIIYADKFLETQGGKVPNREIIDELINNGNKIEIRNVEEAAVTEISLEPAEVAMDKSEIVTVKVKLEGSEDGNIYYAVIDGKYYKINFRGSPLTIEREATEPEGNVSEPASIEVVTGYDTTIVTKAEINQSAKIIEIGSGATYGTTTLTVKYGSNTADCKVTVEETESNWEEIAESNWAEIAEMAKQIASDDSINSDSTTATATIDGVTKTIRVGDIYKVKYNGEIRRVRVLGFKHDDLVDRGAYGGYNAKAGISFEFYDFMTGETYMQMNTSNDNTGGWEASKMRTDLNGTGNTIGGLGANLSNKEYIKQVSKRYIPTYYVEYSFQYSSDYLWLLASSEIVPKNSNNTRYGHAITFEGSQYQYYKTKATEEFGVASVNRVKKVSESGGPKFWFLRSPYFDRKEFFSIVSYNGSLNCTNASTIGGVAPGFCI